MLDTGQLYESSSEVQDAERLYEVWDTGQLYESTSEVQDAEQMYEVLDTGQQYMITVEIGGQRCHKNTKLGTWFMEVEVPELRQMYESNREVWNTEQKADIDKYARAESSINSSSNSAFFDWCTSVRGTNAAGKTLFWGDPASQDMLGRDDVCQQRGEHDHLGQLGAGHVHHLQVRQVVRHTGRPPEVVSRSEHVPGHEEVCGCDESTGKEDKDVNDDIAQKISFRDKYEQKVLEGGGASLVVKCRLPEKQNIVYCCVTFRYSTWGEVHARTDTLVGRRHI